MNWTGRQLDKYDNVEFLYNADGVRVKKGNTRFYVNGTKILAQDNGNKMFFHYGVDGVNGFTLKLSDLVVQHYTYKKNLQGDIIGIYNNNNVLICKYVYDAWGNHKTYVLNNGNYELLTTDNTTTNASIANINPFRYRGYYFDTETGLSV